MIKVANLLKQTFRESDIIARIGGDEFVVLAVEAEEGSRKALPTRLQKELDAHNAEGQQPFKLSISVGVTHYDPERPRSIEELLHGADTSMYGQKRQSG